MGDSDLLEGWTQGDLTREQGKCFLNGTKSGRADLAKELDELIRTLYAKKITFTSFGPTLPKDTSDILTTVVQELEKHIPKR
jgi:hypothetical protein